MRLLLWLVPRSSFDTAAARLTQAEFTGKEVSVQSNSRGVITFGAMVGPHRQ